MGYIFWHAARAQPRARPSSARQSIVLIMKMIFDFLIASGSQKDEQNFKIYVAHNMMIFHFFNFDWAGSSFLARPSSARQWIPLIAGMILTN